MATNDLTIENASIGISEKGLEDFRDQIKTALLTDVSKSIYEKFTGEVTEKITAAWHSPRATDEFLNQMNNDIETLQDHLISLEKQINAAFSDAIKVFSSYDENYIAERRID